MKKLSIKDRMMLGDIELIEEHIASDNNLGCVLAIAGAVINSIKTDIVVKNLKRLKYKNEFEFCANVSYWAIAALHLLGIEEYKGDNIAIIETIEDDFSVARECKQNTLDNQ